MEQFISNKEKYPHLFSPMVIRGKRFKNRIIASPHGCRLPVLELDGTGYAHVTEYGIKYYAGPARGGAAVVNMMEGGVEPGSGGIVTPSYNLFKVNTLATMHLFTDYVHGYGALASMELSHVGQWDGSNPRGPSAKQLYNGVRAEEMTEAEIERVVQQFADAANMVKRGGFDVIMLHAGHNWLLSQFMSPHENKRKDRFGGSTENRARLTSMVLDRIRDRVGDDVVIEMRVSASEFIEDGLCVEETVEILKLLQDRIDIVQCSAGSRNVQRTLGVLTPIYFMPPGEKLPFAAEFKKNLNIPVSVVGSMNDPELADRIIAEGQADFIATARNFIADRDWGNKARKGQAEDIRPCIRCNRCLDVSASMINTARPGNKVDFENGTFHWQCSVNPKESLSNLLECYPKAEREKNVAVIGGGPAGMEAALECAERGHSVTLYEKQDRLGGQLCHADYMGFKKDLRRFKDYMIRQVYKNPRITVCLGQNMTPERVEAENFDAVVVAVGASPIRPAIPGIDKQHVIEALDVFGNESRIGKQTVIIGGGSVGCETALYLADLGKEDITVVEMGDILLADTLYTDRFYTLLYMDKKYDRKNAVYVDKLEDREHQIKSMVRTKCVEITEEGVRAVDQDGNELIIPADTVILAAGMRANSQEADKFYGTAFDVIAAGDCIKASSVHNATSTALYAALQI